MLPLILGLQIGEADITPPEPLPLGGYTARGDAPMQGVERRLRARTAVLRQGDRRVALCSVEMLTIPESLRAKVAGHLPADLDFVLAATHTHSAPDSQMLNARMTFKVPGIAGYSMKWEEWYAKRIASSITNALAQPIWRGRAEWAQSKPGIARSRREGAMQENAFQFRVGYKAAFTVASAHATIWSDSNMKAHGDWPGLYMDRNPEPIFMGEIGNLSPDVEHADSRAAARNLVRRLEGSIKASQALPVEGSMEFRTTTVDLPEPKPHPEFAESFGAPGPMADLLVGKFAAPSARLSVLSLGGEEVRFVPGEPTGGFTVEALVGQLDDEESRPFLTIGLADGWLGYILDREDYEKGGYEATLAFHGPGLSQALNQAFLNLSAAQVPVP